MFQHPGVSGNPHISQGCRRKNRSAAIRSIPLQAEVVSGVPFPFSLRVDSPQIIHTAFHQPVIDLEKLPASIAEGLDQFRLARQFRRQEKVVGGKQLIPGRLLGVRSQPVIFPRVASQTGDVLHRQMQHGVLRHRSVSVSHDPSFMEVGRLLLAHLLSNLVERLRATGSHGKRHRDLLLGQLMSVQRINPAAVSSF